MPTGSSPPRPSESGWSRTVETTQRASTVKTLKPAFGKDGGTVTAVGKLVQGAGRMTGRVDSLQQTSGVIRRIAAGLLFAALFVTGFRISILRLLLPPHRPPDVSAAAGGVDRRPLRLGGDPIPADVLQFVHRIGAHTKPGEPIAVLFASPHEGFSYAYWRAGYVLAGRPMLGPMDLVAPQGQAEVIALWRSRYGDPRYDVVWMDRGSAILRRRR